MAWGRKVIELLVFPGTYIRTEVNSHFINTKLRQIHHPPPPATQSLPIAV